MAYNTEKVSKLWSTVQPTMVSGPKDKNTVTGLLFLSVPNKTIFKTCITTATGTMVKNMALVSCLGKTAPNMMAPG